MSALLVVAKAWGGSTEDEGPLVGVRVLSDMSRHVFEVGNHGRQLLAECGHVGLECCTGCGQLVAHGLELGRLGRERCLLGSHVCIKSGLECR